MVLLAGSRVSLVEKTVNNFNDLPLVFLFLVIDYFVPLAAMSGLNDKAFWQGSEKTRFQAVENPKKRYQVFPETHLPDILPYLVLVGELPVEAVIAEDLSVLPFFLVSERTFQVQPVSHSPEELVFKPPLPDMENSFFFKRFPILPERHHT